MSRVAVVGAAPQSLVNFRGDLIAALVASGHEVVGMASDAEPVQVARLASVGASFRAFPVQRNGLNPLRDLQTYFALCRYMRELAPDVVLAYTIKPIIWTGFALRGMPAIRFYALVTGLGFAFQGGTVSRRFLARVVAWLYRAGLARATRVVFQNPDNRDEFVRRRIVPIEKCAVVAGSGVHLERFCLQPLPPTGVVFLTIGRRLGEKGFRIYAEAARRVKSIYPRAVFRLLGLDDPSPDAISLAEVCEWEARGWIEQVEPTDDVRSVLRDCHVFVLASYHEGMPRTVLEAMATGRPILTTDVPGCRETVNPGENGFLVLKADAEALAERMIWFIEHPEEWRRMGARSRAIAEERFDVAKVNREMIALMAL